MIPVAYPEKAPSIRVLSLPDSIPAPDDARALIEMTFPTYIHLGTSGVRPSLQFMLNRLDHDLPLFLLGKGSPVSVQQPLRQRCFPQRTPPLIENEARHTAQTCAKPKRGGTSELFPADDRPWLIFGVENEGLAPSAGENATLSEELGRERAGGSCTAQGGIGIRNDASSEVVNGGVGFTDGDSELDGDGEQEPTATAESVSAAPLPPAGVDVRIPDVVLCRIATIECTSISVCLRCERCKKLNEIKALAPINTTGHGISHIFCSTCGIEGSIGFYRELLHPSNLKIGRLVVRGMVPTDLHPSSYVTTCESCAAPSPSPHRSVAVGQLLAANCRSCHAQNSFQIQAVQFIRVGGLDIDAGSPPRAETMRRKVRKAKEPGLVIGQCLPDTGTCRHYRKSHRWMRFTCCGKPCDVCHAEAEGHEYEHPCTRMVCGYCSREQPFSDRPCVCGKYTKEKPSTSGFWEGGRGTRDRRQMNRNDPRKFAGLNKTVSTKGTSQQKRSETD
ncbi:MAG: hypothetical protein BJ554DRAFT_6478 [Olpidium bornovanus]|uniref:CHY-type domain-containing protein n=1 Tax=Olpidium bornovanus TaxID=278681 RepID=A0A8H7ZXZ3_9FUNG|nr:MAG: hypothetical protein BJ554DRAFT_6478 [Olpidium bornovanus]